jgi:hypothetical protein
MITPLAYLIAQSQRTLFGMNGSWSKLLRVEMLLQKLSYERLECAGYRIGAHPERRWARRPCRARPLRDRRIWDNLPAVS